MTVRREYKRVTQEGTVRYGTVPQNLCAPWKKIFEKNFLKATSLKKFLREVALFLVPYRTVPLSSMFHTLLSQLELAKLEGDVVAISDLDAGVVE